MDGLINNVLEGKTVENVLKDGEHLIVRTTDGHEVYIGWVDGEPVHIKTSVRIIIPTPKFMGGIAGAF